MYLLDTFERNACNRYKILSCVYNMRISTDLFSCFECIILLLLIIILIITIMINRQAASQALTHHLTTHLTTHTPNTSFNQSLDEHLTKRFVDLDTTRVVQSVKVIRIQKKRIKRNIIKQQLKKLCIYKIQLKYIYI